jgi:hypothetical protein
MDGLFRMDGVRNGSFFLMTTKLCGTHCERILLGNASPTQGLPVACKNTRCGDGSGDDVVELPDELIYQLEWELGDEITVSRNDVGEIVIRRSE